MRPLIFGVSQVELGVSKNSEVFIQDLTGFQELNGFALPKWD